MMSDLSHLPAAAALVAELDALQDDARQGAWLAVADLVHEAAEAAPEGEREAELAAASDVNSSGFPAQVGFLFARNDPLQIERLIRDAVSLPAPVLSMPEFRAALRVVLAAQLQVRDALRKEFPGAWPAGAEQRVLADLAAGFRDPLARFIAAVRPGAAVLTKKEPAGR